VREQRYEPRILTNREVRTIPQGWLHPRDERSRSIPLLSVQMPTVDGAAEVMAYETTSEGTPISPAFSATPEGRLQLVRYCAEHLTTFGPHHSGVEAWVAILFGEDATISPDGTVRA